MSGDYEDEEQPDDDEEAMSDSSIPKPDWDEIARFDEAQRKTMADSIPEYILRPEAVFGFDINDESVALGVADGWWAHIPNEGFRELFVPLDRQALTEQLHDILNRREHSVEDMWAKIPEIFRLFGLENKESNEQ